MEETGTLNFNMALSTLQRMDSCLRMISFYSHNRDYFKWRDCLFDLRRMVFPFLKKDKRENMQKLYDKIIKNRWGSKDTKGNLKINPRKVNEIYFLLDDLTLQMQIEMKNEGLSMPVADDPKFALDS